MIRTQLYIPDELYHQAKIMAEFDGVSISEYMRDGLSMKISAKKHSNKNKKKKDISSIAGMFSLGKGTVTNVALNHNDIYDE